MSDPPATIHKLTKGQKMKLDEFKALVTAQRLAEITEKRTNNLTAIMSVAGATISETNEGKTK